MRRTIAAHRRAAAGVAVLFCALAAPTLGAEPRERWPEPGGSSERGGDARGGAAPDLLADLLPGRCNGAKLGAIAGAALGGVLGSRIADGDGSTAATLAGTLIGALVGGRIGQSIDDGDERCGSTPPPPADGVISTNGERTA